MSLNWKEINLILEELDLEGSQIQGVVQSAFDVIILRVRTRAMTHNGEGSKGQTKQLLISLSSGACRLHETFAAAPKSAKPLRFAQFLASKIVNGWITQAVQLENNRIIRLLVKRGASVFKLYIRLWSNAANFIVTDETGAILDAMRRLPKRGEVTGGKYTPEQAHDASKTPREFNVREFPGDESFNKKIDAFYAAQGGPLSLEALREQARRTHEGSIAAINAALERLKEKEKEFAGAERLKTFGDLILSNIAIIKSEDTWLEAEADGETVRIKLEPRVSPAAQAGKYYDQYRKSKNAVTEIQREIEAGEQELAEVTERLSRLLTETNPLILAKLLKSARASATSAAGTKKKEKARPGLTFKRGDWLLFVGRNAAENDELLRRHVKGNDTWLHARDYHGSYVFIKQRAGKTIPLDILLDAGNLAIFYSKGRNNAGGDLFYTQAKYLRRAKNAPKGLVIPTQEKNLHVKLDEARLRSIKNCRVV